MPPGDSGSIPALATPPRAPRAPREAVILHVITNLEVGGAQISTADICAGLAARGWRVHLAYSPRGGETGRESPELIAGLRAAGVGVHAVPAMRRSILPAGDLRAIGRLWRLIRGLRADVVHTHMSKAGILARWAGRLARTPHLLHTARGWSFYREGGALERRIYLALERGAGRHTDLTLAVSPVVARDGAAAGIGPEARFRVVRSGIRLDRFREARPLDRAALGLPAGVPLVGCVMGLVEAKAPLDFVAAAARIARRHDRVHFVVAGEGPLRRAVEAAARREGIADRLHLLGQRDDIPGLLPLFQVFMLASRWEGLPRVVVEASAAGVPVVATAVGGTPEVLCHGESAILAAPGDVDALAEGCLRLLEDPALRARHAEAARRAVTAEFGLDAVIDAHEQVYAEVLAGRYRIP